MIKRFGSIVMVFLGVCNILLYLFNDEHTRFEGVVVSSLLILILLAYEVWVEILYFEEPDDQ